jgi:hypothetical protein
MEAAVVAPLAEAVQVAVAAAVAAAVRQVADNHS